MLYSCSNFILNSHFRRVFTQKNTKPIWLRCAAKQATSISKIENIWKIFHPNSGERPTGGNWDTGYTREGRFLIVFMNIDTESRTGHDFANEYNEEDETTEVDNNIII